MFLRAETKNAFKTVSISIMSSYIKSDLEFLNKLLITNCKINKTGLIQLLKEKNTENFIDTSYNKIIYGACEFRFNENNELISVNILQ